jgi:hypothetical protein
MSPDTPTEKKVRRAPAVPSQTTQAFCAECGTKLAGAKFCPSCGTATVNGLADPTPDVIVLPDTVRSALPTQRATSPAIEQPTVPFQPGPAESLTFSLPEPRDVEPGPWSGAPTAYEPESKSRTTVIVALVSVIVLLLVAGGVALVLSTRGGSSKAPAVAPDRFPGQARSALEPVMAANATLTTAIAGLHGRSSASGARSAVTAATTAATTAQATLAGLIASTPADRAAAAASRAALTSELAWLTAASAVLSDPSSSQLSQLSSLGIDATAKLAALSSTVHGTSSTFPSSSTLVGYAGAQAKTAETKSTTTQFISSVGALITQSEPAFQQINQLFGQLTAVANGGGTDLTLAQLEQTISTVVANRTSLAASARAITASTPGQRRVRAALVAAMDASLGDDQAIDDCLNEENDGNIAFIFQGCLSSTTSSAADANSAKSHFWSTYNALRHTVGDQSTHASF